LHFNDDLGVITEFSFHINKGVFMPFNNGMLYSARSKIRFPVTL